MKVYQFLLASAAVTKCVLATQILSEDPSGVFMEKKDDSPATTTFSNIQEFEITMISHIVSPSLTSTAPKKKSTSVPITQLVQKITKVSAVNVSDYANPECYDGGASNQKYNISADPNVDQLAIAALKMNTHSFPYCFDYVQLSNGDKSVYLRIGDDCPDCASDEIRTTSYWIEQLGYTFNDAADISKPTTHPVNVTYISSKPDSTNDFPPDNVSARKTPTPTKTSASAGITVRPISGLLQFVVIGLLSWVVYLF